MAHLFNSRCIWNLSCESLGVKSTRPTPDRLGQAISTRIVGYASKVPAMFLWIGQLEDNLSTVLPQQKFPSYWWTSVKVEYWTPAGKIISHNHNDSHSCAKNLEEGSFIILSLIKAMPSYNLLKPKRKILETNWSNKLLHCQSKEFSSAIESPRNNATQKVRTAKPRVGLATNTSQLVIPERRDKGDFTYAVPNQRTPKPERKD